MNSWKRVLALITLLAGLAVAPATLAQTLLTDDFTGATSSNTGGVGNWLFYNGACLTAGVSTVLTPPAASIPGCTAVLLSYYNNAADSDSYLVGGANGFLGGSTQPASPSQQQPDPASSPGNPVGGALRFTNGAPFGNQERGAILSRSAYSTNAGIQVTFKTVTYGGTGADGISFYLMDGCAPVAGAVMPTNCPANPIYPAASPTVPGIGATGGSLAFSCSNTNGPGSGSGVTYDGLTGGYLGLGIDEYGNFLNQGDNTATGYGFQPGRIGLRGAGSISWAALNNAYGNDPGDLTKPYYPASLSVTDQQTVVQAACRTGTLRNYSTGTSTPASSTQIPTTLGGNSAGILDYAAIVGQTLPAANPLFNGAATKRSQATPIFYNLKITADGLLSLSYAWNGGSYVSVISNQSIINSNGSVPSYVRFGFAGSTGGATNVHEILCFKSAPAVQSGSSAGVNEKQSAKVESGTFAYFAYYDQNNWVGRVTANALSTDTTTGTVSLATTPTWDASCVLTGVVTGQTCSTGATGPVTAMTPASRQILTFDGTVGRPFEWGSLSSAQQTALTTGDSTQTPLRLNYLRGDRSNEVTTAFTCSGGLTDTNGQPVCFRARTSVLADIVDSSPTWVGPPQSPYTATWQDKLYTGTSAPENTVPYLSYLTAEQTRTNVVYVGSNDGMLHGFRSGSFNTDGTFNPTNNDGQEVVAYMPGSLLLSPSTGGACASLAATGSIVQNIHGVTPAYSTQPACVTSALDFSSTQYGHNFFVDATPGTGDLYYNGAWHSWLIGGLGAGGAAIFALDVTNPGNFSESNAASLVMGEWTSATISCVGNTTCGQSLGNTYGTPIIRRLHDGNWGIIFGNGLGSQSGDAGIFVMLVNGTTGVPGNVYYLSTGTAGGNGISYVTSADLDGDHITDYVYAGDLQGNLWRFDLTSATETQWQVSTGPLFKTQNGQPITTAVTVSSGSTPAGASTLMIAFGTGMRTQFSNAAPVSYCGSTGSTCSGTQSLYGVWDWNMSSWNSQSTTQYASLAPPPVSGLASPYTLTAANLAQQTFTLNPDGVTRDIAATTICWAGSICTTSRQFGWYLNLYGSLEQIVFNPQLLQGVFTVNSTVPANNQVLSCTINTDTGFTYAIQVLTGNVSPNFFVSYHDTMAGGIQTNAVGSSFPVTSSTGATYLVSQTVTNQPILTQVNPGAAGKGRRLSWVQLR